MGLVTDMERLHYPDRIFTLFQEVGNIVEIACPCSIFTMSANLFHKTECGKIFNSRINCFPVHLAFFCNEPPRWKTGTSIIIAVPEQAAVYGKIFRLQSEIKNLVGHHKEILMQHCILLSFSLIFKLIVLINILPLQKNPLCNESPSLYLPQPSALKTKQYKVKNFSLSIRTVRSSL